MTGALVVLLIDSHPADRSLSRLLLRQELPQAIVKEVRDALELAEELASGRPDVALVSADLHWATVRDLAGTIKRRSPGTAVILIGRKAHLQTRVLSPGLACDGIVSKSSAGFLSLGSIITSALARVGSDIDRFTTSPGARPELLPESTHAAGAPTSDSCDSLDVMREMTLLFSHDLTEPMHQLVRLARQSLNGDGASGSFLQDVLDRAERLNRMLDGITEYLVVTGRSAEPAPIDLSVCLERAIDNLRPSIVEAGAEIQMVDHRLMSIGDEHQITHLFQNLVSNTIKFRQRARPVIAITAGRCGDRWLMRFRDNGIGIPEDSTERIFELGTRLHPGDQYPGAGIGLALCRQIVERHGGRIWVESRLGEGSTFMVLLPFAGETTRFRGQ
jgi:signal transduction histidine kinase